MLPVVFLSFDAIVAISSCLVAVLMLLLIFVAYARRKQPPPKHYMIGVDPKDEVRETIINYVEEGCPDVDQSAYDITQLAKLIDPSMSGSMMSHQFNTMAIDEFQPAVPKQKPPVQEVPFIRRGEFCF